MSDDPAKDVVKVMSGLIMEAEARLPLLEGTRTYELMLSIVEPLPSSTVTILLLDAAMAAR